MLARPSASLHMAAMTVTLPPQREPVNCSAETPAAREDTMTGSDLLVEIPWIIFGVLLAAACLRLRRIRRFARKPREPESRRVSGDDNDSSANTGEPAGNDHDGTAVRSSKQQSSAQP
jgi:hypothetical protein